MEQTVLATAYKETHGFRFAFAVYPFAQQLCYNYNRDHGIGI